MLKKPVRAKQSGLQAMIYIGAEESAISEAHKTIVDILTVPHIDNQTRVEALRALGSVCSVNNVNLSNINLTHKEAEASA